MTFDRFSKITYSTSMSFPEFKSPNKNQNSFNFSSLQALKNISNCPVCQAKYDPLQASLIQEEEDAYLAYIKCQKCRTAMLVLIMAQGPLLSSVGVVTDLTPEDLDILKRKSISSDDILSLYQAFKSQDLIRQLNN